MLVTNNIKWISGILSIIIYTAAIWFIATRYQFNKDDIKTKANIIKSQKVKISQLEAERIYNYNLINQLESQNTIYISIVESKNQEIKNARKFIESHKNYINNTNFITDDFVRLLAGTYPFNINMPFNSTTEQPFESASRITPTDTILYCREWRGYAEKYVANFEACRSQYNTVMKNNNEFIKEYINDK